MARVLILGGGRRGMRLASELGAEGHAVRIVTRCADRRAEIEQAGAEYFGGDPNRLGTLRGALENVTVACWLLATATGTREQLRALHVDRLRSFLAQTIDTTVRGFLYEAGGAAVPYETLAAGERAVAELTQHNAIPAAVLRADPTALEGWLPAARGAIGDLLA